jgi:hypothetical protein
MCPLLLLQIRFSILFLLCIRHACPCCSLPPPVFCRSFSPLASPLDRSILCRPRACSRRAHCSSFGGDVVWIRELQHRRSGYCLCSGRSTQPLSHSEDLPDSFNPPHLLCACKIPICKKTAHSSRNPSREYYYYHNSLDTNAYWVE